MEGRVIAITGGASGIGLATAKLLASRGARLSLADISGAHLASAKNDIKRAAPKVDDILTCECDVRELSQVEGWMKQTVEKFGKLDGACNLAGTIGPNPCTTTIEDLDEDAWDLIIGVNLTGVMHSIKAEVKHMKKGAAIVNAASLAGLTGHATMAAYVASKHGVVGLTKTAAKEFGTKGIRVNAIAPGYVKTPMTAALKDSVGTAGTEGLISMMPLQRGAEPEEIATLIAFLLSDEASYITGAVHTIDGGMNA